MNSNHSLFTAYAPSLPPAVTDEAKTFLEKVIRVRSYLLASKEGNCSAAMHQALKSLKQWYLFYKPTNQQCATYIRRHQDQIRMMLPGQGTRNHQYFLSTLNRICND